MWIDNVYIQNFRSFHSPTLISNFKKINVFIGRSGSGKTNVIHALYLLKALRYNEYENKIVQEIVFDLQAENEISIALQIRPSEQERKRILNRFLKIKPGLTYSSQEKNFLSKIKYSIIIQTGRIIQEVLSISINSKDFVDILVRK